MKSKTFPWSKHWNNKAHHQGMESVMVTLYYAIFTFKPFCFRLINISELLCPISFILYEIGQNNAGVTISFSHRNELIHKCIISIAIAISRT